jgi:hypothetical protein
MEKLEKTEKKDPKTDELMHGFKSKNSSFLTPKLIGILLVVALLGLGSGYFLSTTQSSSSDVTPGKRLLGSGVEKGKTYGEGDVKEFKDTAEGELKEGGIEGEGQYHLVRPGGDSQNVYVTSSQVDLSLFIDRKVKVWGATQTAQVAGWLMDVGRVQVLE